MGADQAQHTQFASHCAAAQLAQQLHVVDGLARGDQRRLRSVLHRAGGGGHWPRLQARGRLSGLAERRSGPPGCHAPTQVARSRERRSNEPTHSSRKPPQRYNCTGSIHPLCQSAVRWPFVTLHFIAMPMLFCRVLAVFVCVLGSTSAAAADVDLSKPPPTAQNRSPVKLADGGSSPTVALTLWKSDVLFGELIGKIESGLFCTSDRRFVFNKQFDDWLVAAMTRTFKDRAIHLGYASPSATKSVFDDKGGGDADFRIGGTLLNVDYRVCGDDTIKGDAYANVKWEVFSVRRQKVVFSASIAASFSSPNKIPTREFDNAFNRAMVDNLLGDPRFAEVIRSGGASEDNAAKALPPLQLNAGVVVAGGIGKATQALREAVVTVESGVSTGSAFYVSQDGYLLTNSHVVGDAKFVRVKLATGRSTVGEVLRVDRQRDVALVRTDPVTFGVLALRPQAASVGEEVHAIGSPFGDQLSGTVTRGVLSARRVIEGVAYLQSDVAINPGSSGGPLIDVSGMVVGITQLAGRNMQCINLFIPIDDALDKLVLALRAKDGPERSPGR
jgi:serine protease Do